MSERPMDVFQIFKMERDRPLVSLIGPLFLLCTLLLAAAHPDSLNCGYLFLAALAGLFLTIQFQMKGFLYSLLGLATAAFLKYGFLAGEHLWQLGFEGSLACGLFITALTSEQRKSYLAHLRETAETRQSTIAHLEEDLAKLRESSQTVHIAAQEKIAEKQKELEELQAEHSSILVLNEVLRKTSAQQTEEAEILAEKSLDQSRKIGMLLSEIDALQNELSRISNESALKAENDLLVEQINTARVELAQAELLNESLAHRIAKEAREFQQASERFHGMQGEKTKLQEDLGAAKGEIQMLSNHLEQTSKERDQALDSLKLMEKTRLDALFFQNRLGVAERDLAAKSQRETHLLATIEQFNQQILERSPENLQRMKQERDKLAQHLADKETRLSSLEVTFNESRKKSSETLELLESDRLHLSELLARKEAELGEVQSSWEDRSREQGETPS